MSRFEGRVVAEWLHRPGGDRPMKILEPFGFIDSAGYRWEAMPGDVIDGASIPRVFWTIDGSPYTGNYRRASVLHDVACQQHMRTSREVHRMFYEAMVCDGVEPGEALRKYTAVRLFGPMWDRAPETGAARMLTRPPTSFEQCEAALDAILTPRGLAAGVDCEP